MEDSSRMSTLLKRRPKLVAVLLGFAGSALGYVLCYLLGLLAMSLWASTAANPDEFVVQQFRDAGFIVAALCCGSPIPFTIGVLVGLPVYDLGMRRGWSTRATVVTILSVSALLGAIACGPWNLFVLFASAI